MGETQGQHSGYLLGVLACESVFSRLRWVARVPGSRWSLHWNTLPGTGEKETLFREWTSEKNTSQCLNHTQNILKETLRRRKALEIQWMTNVKQHRCHSQIQNVWGQKQGSSMCFYSSLRQNAAGLQRSWNTKAAEAQSGNSREHCSQKSQGGVVWLLFR